METEEFTPGPVHPPCHHGNCNPSPKSCRVELRVEECNLEITLHAHNTIKKMEIEIQGHDYQFYS